MSANNPASSSSAASKSKSKAKAKAKPRAWNKFPTLKLSAITGLERLRQSGQRILKEILNECDHPICCVLDPDLTRPLNLVTEGPQIFKDNGVRIFDELTPALDLKTKIDDKRKKNVVIKSILCLLKPTVRTNSFVSHHRVRLGPLFLLVSRNRGGVGFFISSLPVCLPDWSGSGIGRGVLIDRSVLWDAKPYVNDNVG